MLQKICAFILRRVGWKLEGEVPRAVPRLVLVLMPHTSNWDFVICWLFIRAERLQITLFGKDGFYFFPFKYFYSWFGVVPIKRGQKANFVEMATSMYQQREHLWTAMAPEGTRSYMPSLKSGYYHLARKANVPVVVVGIDYSKKQIKVLPPRPVMASFEEDAAELVNFSHGMRAKHPESTL